MEYISRIFFPKPDHSSEENSKEDEDEQEDDLYLEGSYSNQRINMLEARFYNSNRMGRPTMMSEREVRSIMHQYNGSIDQFTREIVDLKSHCRKLDNEISRLKKESLVLEEENIQIQHDMHNSYAEKERIQSKINNYDNNINLVHESKLSTSTSTEDIALKNEL